jgi:hypothetical protein
VPGKLTVKVSFSEISNFSQCDLSFPQERQVQDGGDGSFLYGPEANHGTVGSEGTDALESGAMES